MPVHCGKSNFQEYCYKLLAQSPYYAGWQVSWRRTSLPIWGLNGEMWNTLKINSLSHCGVSEEAVYAWTYRKQASGIPQTLDLALWCTCAYSLPATTTKKPLHYLWSCQLNLGTGATTPKLSLPPSQANSQSSLLHCSWNAATAKGWLPKSLAKKPTLFTLMTLHKPCTLVLASGICW